MAFDWLQFVQHHGVPHRTEGKNVKAGWLVVQCPFCGPVDPGQHMGLNPASGGWSCWRDPTHRGMSVPKMIKALLGVQWGKAVELAGDWREPGAAAWDELAAMVKGVDQADYIVRPRSQRYPPSGCQRLRNGGATAIHFRYLAGRKIRESDLPKLVELYQLRAGVSGTWRSRILIPFIGRSGKVYGWQGRAIGRTANLRYVSHPDSSSVKDLLFNYGPAKAAKRKRVLVVVEGPLDCIKVDFYGRRKGIRAVGTLGTSFTDRQVGAIYDLAPEYDYLVILFDPGAEGAALELCDRLATFQPILGSVPDGVDDPGDLRPSQVVPTVLAFLPD